MQIIVTGGAGFIGSHFIRYTLAKYPDLRIINVDSLTYAAHPDTAKSLEQIAPGRYQFLHEDITSPKVADLIRSTPVDAVVNFAAETHVDRSILEPAIFVMTNIKGVENLLNAARKKGGVRFVQVSTDEVYGSLSPTDPKTIETCQLSPNSPYAASKASADLLVLANNKTYAQDVVVTRCTNNYGPYQFPEKFLPLMIANALEGLPIPIYGDGQQVRDWIYVEDHCEAIDLCLRKGVSGEIYNIASDGEKKNVDVAKLVLKKMGKPETLLKTVGDRPGHDRRYGLDATKIMKDLGWKPATTFEAGLEKTIEWYKKNEPWWRKLRGKEFYDYYSANYDVKFKSAAAGTT
jgi:dTDP-glucose 4,6-dehydratase